MPLSVGMLPKLTEVIYTERVSKVGFFIALDYPLGTRTLMSLWSFKVDQVLNVFRYKGLLPFLYHVKLKVKLTIGMIKRYNDNDLW